MGSGSDKMKIGDLTIDIPIIMAPMAGVTDYPFRQILRKMGCRLVFTEMVSSKGLVYDDDHTSDLIDFSRNDGLIGVQIFGNEPDFMAEAAEIVEMEYKPDLIDINMGCPTPKIVKNGAGSALMKDEKLAGQVMGAVVSSVEIPVTIKIRTGWDQKHINALKITQIAQNQGIKAVTIHGRSREQFYKGKADWDIIQDIAEESKLPIIGNGDIFSPEDALDKLENTNCQAVMLARGVQGNPWLIKRIIQYLKSGELIDKPTYKEVIEMAKIHLLKACDYYGEDRGIPKMRKHLSWYLKGMPYSTTIKDKINQTSDLKTLTDILNNYLLKLEY